MLRRVLHECCHKKGCDAACIDVRPRPRKAVLPMARRKISATGRPRSSAQNGFFRQARRTGPADWPGEAESNRLSPGRCQYPVTCKVTGDEHRLTLNIVRHCADFCKDVSVLLVYITVPHREEAEELARHLVQTGLAAGVNMLPGVRSVYRWQGVVHERDERVLIAQTRADRFDDLERAVRARHSDEVPCIVALPICQGSAPFLDWIASTARPAADTPPCL